MHRLQTRFEINCTPEFSTKGRCVQVPIWSLVHPPKFQWCHASRFFEHGNKMTGIGKTGHAGDILHFEISVYQQKLFCFVNAVHSQVLVDGAGEKTSEQAGQILW